jgi:Hemagglutinin repeat
MPAVVVNILTKSPPATSGANRRFSFVAHSHALTHAAYAARVYISKPTVAHATRSRQPFGRTTHQASIYPSNQPVVQVSIAQSAIKFIVLSNLDQNTTHQTNSSSSSVGASMGIGAKGAGPSFTIAASKGQGNGAGAEVTHNNTRIEGNTVRIQSGGNTTLAGAVVKADTVNADIQGNLAITSLQDTSAYNETSKTSGGSVTFSGAGVPTGASISSGSSKINSNYASVNEQTGIRAGDGGFNVNVGGKTDLVGGQITSTDKAEGDKKNSFTSTGPITTSDIQNTAAYNASANSITVGVGSDLNKSGAGTGKASGSAASTTQSGITGVAGKKDAKTGDKEVGIQPIFDKDKVKADVDAQVQITKQFGQNASKAVGDLATSKLKEAVGLKEKALEEKDPVKRAEMIKEAQSMEANWGEGGAARVALHTFSAALSGGATAAAGAAAVATAMPVVADQLDKAGVSPEAKQVLTQLLAVGILSNSASAAAAGLNVDSNNRALHEQETKLLKAKSQEFSDKLKERGLDVTPAQAQAILKEQAENRIDMSAAKIPDTATGNDAIKAEAQKFINQLGKEAGTYDDGTGKKTQFFTNKDPQGNVRDKDFYDPKMFADIKKAEDGKFTGTISAGAYGPLGAGVELEFVDGKVTGMKVEAGVGLGGHLAAGPKVGRENPVGPGAKQDITAYATSGEPAPGEGRIGINLSVAGRAGPAQAEVTLVSGGLRSNNNGNTGTYYDVLKASGALVPSLSVGAEGKLVFEWSYKFSNDVTSPKGK